MGRAGLASHRWLRGRLTRSSGRHDRLPGDQLVDYTFESVALRVAHGQRIPFDSVVNGQVERPSAIRVLLLRKVAR